MIPVPLPWPSVTQTGGIPAGAVRPDEACRGGAFYSAAAGTGAVLCAGSGVREAVQ